MPAAEIGSDADYIYQAVVRCDLPVGYWKLASGAGELIDSGGQSVVALAKVGTPTSVSGLVHDGDGGRDLNGSSQAYTRSDSGDNLLDLGDSFSLELWVKPDAFAHSMDLISKGNGAYQLNLFTDGKLYLQKKGTGNIVSSTIALSAGAAYHVVATKDGADSAKIYVNGVDVSSAVTDRTCVNTSTDLNIGRSSDVANYFDGTLDDVALYAYPLTADMVLCHYEAGHDGTFGLSPMGYETGEGDMPRIKVEIAPEGDWNEPYPRWHDVTGRIRARAQTTLALSGRGDENSETQPGTCSTTFDVRDDRLLDPTYSGGEYQVAAGCPVRFRAEWDGTHYWLWKGWMESWLPSFPDSGTDAIVVASGVDILARLNVDFPEGTALGEAFAGDRIADCLDLLQIPENQRNLDTGISTLPAIEEASGTILSHSLAAATSDGGFPYAAADGRIVYETRTYRALHEATSRGTFGDARDGVELPFVSLEPAADDAYLFNQIKISSGDNAGVGYAEDAASAARHGPRGFSKSLLTGFNECQAAAEWYLARYKDGGTRFPSATTNGRIDADLLWPVILGLANSQRYTWLIRPLGGDTLDVDQFVERIQHEIGNADWKTSLSLTPFGGEDPWPLDDPAYVLGTNTYPTW